MTQRERVRAAAALHDPVRWDLLKLVSERLQPVTRDEAAAELGVPRSTVAFHLDRLVEAGVLIVHYRRVNGITGPGSGRPSKTYTRAPGEFSVSIPERRYDLMGDLLATAIETAPDGGSVRDALRDSAATAGRQAGKLAGSLETLLVEVGYEPAPADAGTVLTNCPFHRLASAHTDVVCAANHAFLRGAADATGRDPRSVLLEPSNRGCCVRIEG